jgi:hypothetical protein
VVLHACRGGALVSCVAIVMAAMLGRCR